MQTKVFGAIVAALVATPLLTWDAFAVQEAQDQEEQESVLHGSMEDLNATLRKVNRMVKDPEQLGAAVELVVSMERNVLDSKGEVPHRAEALEGAAKDEFVLAFRRDMIRLLVTLTELESGLPRRQGRRSPSHPQAHGQAPERLPRALPGRVAPRPGSSARYRMRRRGADSRRPWQARRQFETFRILPDSSTVTGETWRTGIEQR